MAWGGGPENPPPGLNLNLTLFWFFFYLKSIHSLIREKTGTMEKKRCERVTLWIYLMYSP